MTELAQPRTGGWARRAPIAPLWAMVLTGCLVTVALVTSVLMAAPVGTRSVALPVFLIGAVVVFGVGVTDLARSVEPRFAVALIIAGLFWSLSALSASTHPFLYSAGRLNQWLAHLAVVYLLLSYPSGRLTDRTARLLFAGAALLLGFLYLPLALFGGTFPAPALWTACGANCPHDAFALGHSTPALARDLVVPLRGLLAIALLVAVAVVVSRRRQHAGALLGSMYAPIAWISVALAVGAAVYVPMRAGAPGSWALTALSWIAVLWLPAIALACGAGRLYRRVQAANALDRLARTVRVSTTSAEVRRALAEALHDPSLGVLRSFPDGSGSWVDESGSPVPPPAVANEQVITEISDGGGRIAILHDPALCEDLSLVRTAGSYALTALEKERLDRQLRSSRAELARSRSRSIAAKDRERQKIGRDLHDGAQQRLVAIRLKLGLAACQLEDRDPNGAAALRALEEDIEATIDDVRSFASGVFPPMLAETGLGEALRSIGRLAALPTTVRAEQLGRFAPEIETTVYFCCSESLQNAAKHARGATGVTISVWRGGGRLHFEIRDDGCGFDVGRTPSGTGLSNLEDRLAAVDGTIAINSARGRGTTVAGSIPL